MLGEITATEWFEWVAFMQLSPSATELEIESLRTASIVGAIWNVQIAKAQGSWDAAKRKSGKRPEFRQLHELIMRFGDMPDYTPPEKPNKRGHALFDSFVDHFESLGMKPVKR